ncbi:MAG TPA: FAD-dependent oxidoreductase [Dehalococcoidia bacterium]|nr:FAD-dependent oxidoreductase [Dehalococcoidia bacterium]
MKYDFDVTIVGAGSAGMIAAEAAAEMGVKVALVERDRIGGDCLWTGCVPSKALLASAKAAHTVRHADSYGLKVAELTVDTEAVWRRLKAIQHDIATTDDSPDRYERMGVKVISGEARFAGKQVVQVGGRKLRTRYALICTGSRPAALPIDGLEDAGYLTSENIFELDRAPQSIVILGGGPIGTEMAQAMARLSVETTMLERGAHILARDEPELTDILLSRLRSEGVDVRTGVEVVQVARTPQGTTVTGKTSSGEETWSAEAVLVAAGRRPNIETLGLDEAGVKTGKKGISVDDRLRTSVDWIYAAGDCAGRYLFTHTAAAEATTALRNMFFPGSASAPEPVPWTTFSDPELAHVGLTSDEARKTLGKDGMRVFHWDLAHSDRARADGATHGAMIVVTDDKFRIQGAHILSPSAGEMIGQFTLAIQNKLKLTPDFGNLIQVYPTYSTSISQTAAEATYGQLRKPFLRTVRKLTGLFRL